MIFKYSMKEAPPMKIIQDTIQLQIMSHVNIPFNQELLRNPISCPFTPYFECHIIEWLRVDTKHTNLHCIALSSLSPKSKPKGLRSTLNPQMYPISFLSCPWLWHKACSAQWPGVSLLMKMMQWSQYQLHPESASTTRQALPAPWPRLSSNKREMRRRK